MALLRQRKKEAFFIQARESIVKRLRSVHTKVDDCVREVSALYGDWDSSHRRKRRMIRSIQGMLESVFTKFSHVKDEKDKEKLSSMLGDISQAKELIERSLKGIDELSSRDGRILRRDLQDIKKSIESFIKYEMR